MPVDIVEAIASWAKSQLPISVDESFKERASAYLGVISESKKLPPTSQSDKEYILAIVTERAVSNASRRGKHFATGEDFQNALLEFKGPIIDPTDRCEKAAAEILKSKNRGTRISESLRRLLDARRGQGRRAR